MGSFERARRRREERAARKAGQSPASADTARGDGAPSPTGAKEGTAAAPRGVSAYGDVPGFDLCREPLHYGKELAPTANPLVTLGLDPTRRATEGEVRAAFQRLIAEHPPERSPEVARAAIDARDRLLRPERALERELGVVYVPDPAKYGLASQAGEGAAASPAAPKVLPSEGRLMASLALYALLEAELGAD